MSRDKNTSRPPGLKTTVFWVSLSLIITAMGLALPLTVFGTTAAEPETRVLFIGNSLTYVGDLPRVFERISAGNGHPVRTNMIAQAGATLTQHLAYPVTRHTLQDGGYDYVILQERGGDVICAFGPSSCEDARTALAEFAGLAASAGTTPIYLGTYQYAAAVSDALIAAEQELTDELDIAHVPISQALQQGLRKLPHARWLDVDGMHPGQDLTLLKAALIHARIFAQLPAPIALSMDGQAVVAGSESQDEADDSVESVSAVLNLLRVTAETDNQ